MTEEPRTTRTLRRLRPVEREAVRIADGGLVALDPRPAGRSLPAMITASLEGIELVAWARANRPLVESLLEEHGAVLFRSFDAGGLPGLAEFVKAVAGELLEYRERSSPRTHVTANIYTSTEYPAHQSIFLHNENSYAHTWPLKLFFLCSIAPLQGGATPIADCRQILNAIDPEIRDEFIRKKIMYVRNLNEEVGLSWQAVFGTSDRDAVERQCRDAGYQVAWTGTNGLRTKRVGPAVARHPRTGEMAWFNHATFFHVSTLEPEVREALLAQFGEEDLPNNTYYGDGSPIEPQVMGHIREAYERAKVSVPWQTEDILLVDNMLTAHGREPFVGPRRIHVAMAEPCTEQDV